MRTSELRVEFFAKSGFEQKYTGYNLKKVRFNFDCVKQANENGLLEWANPLDLTE